MDKRQIIDLSIGITPGLPSDPPMMIPQIEYVDHKAGAEQMKDFFPGLKTDQLPGGLGWAMEQVTLTTHSGTHLDAPYHYHPTMDNGEGDKGEGDKGKKSLTIDQIPLEWCFGDGVVLDFSSLADGERITVEHIQEELKRIKYDIKPLDIVLIRTGADKYWGKEVYLVKGCGMTKESTLFLLEKGVRVTGIDAWSWDRPLPYIAQEFEKTKNADIIWEAHFAGIEKGYCHMEKLANLDKIPKPHGFKISCFPIKITSASAGWVRAVAIVD